MHARHIREICYPGHLSEFGQQNKAAYRHHLLCCRLVFAHWHSTAFAIADELTLLACDLLDVNESFTLTPDRLCQRAESWR